MALVWASYEDAVAGSKRIFHLKDIPCKAKLKDPHVTMVQFDGNIETAHGVWCSDCLVKADIPIKGRR